MNFSVRKLFFIPGLCWGGLWIKELFLYPELWFFACCAAGTGAGYWLAGRIKQEYRCIAGFAALLILAMLPAGEVRTMLFPVIFGWYCAWKLAPAEVLWQKNRSFCGGFLLGAVAVTVYSGALFMPLLLCCAALEFDRIRQNISAFAAVAAVTAAGCWYSGRTVTVPVPEVLRQGEVITALSWVKAGERTPQVVFLGGRRSHVVDDISDFYSTAKISYVDTVSAIPVDADMIFAVNVSSIGDGGVNKCARMLKDGGILVVPADVCGALPGWEFLELPGSNGRYAVAGKGRKLHLNPDEMDANFSAMHRERHNPPLAGALAGMLMPEKEKSPVVHPVQKGYTRWLVFLAVLSCVLILDSLRSLSRSDRKRDMLTAALNSAGHTLLAVVLLEMIFARRGGFPGVANVFFALGVIWFIRKSTGRWTEKGKYTLWILFAGLLVVTLFFRLDAIMFAALVCSGILYSELDEEIIPGRPVANEPARFLAIACGIGAAWLLGWCAVPLTYQLLIAAGVRSYTWFRN